MPLYSEDLPCGCSISLKLVEHPEDLVEKDGWELWESECPACGNTHLYLVHIEGKRVN